MKTFLTNKRNWKTYTQSKLVEELEKIDWLFRTDDVQSFWDLLEDRIVGVCDDLIPYESYVNSKPVIDINPPFIKNKLNRRSRLLKLFNSNKNPLLKKNYIASYMLTYRHL